MSQTDRGTELDAKLTFLLLARWRLSPSGHLLTNHFPRVRDACLRDFVAPDFLRAMMARGREGKGVQGTNLPIWNTCSLCKRHVQKTNPADDLTFAVARLTERLPGLYGNCIKEGGRDEGDPTQSLVLQSAS